MVNTAKNKGTFAETAVVMHLVGSGIFPDAHRSALSGSNDIGDIIGCPDVAIQVKNQATYSYPEWLRDTEVQRQRADKTFGLLIAKRSGFGSARVGSWFGVMLSEPWKKLWREAGKPGMDFSRAGKSPSQAMRYLPQVPNHVITVEFQRGIEIAGNDSYRIMNLDGVLRLFGLRATAGTLLPGVFDGDG